MLARTGLVSLLLGLTLQVGGCGIDTRGTNRDFAVDDLSLPPDLAGRDMASVDLARGPDLVGEDLAKAGDMTTPGDMSVPVDMTMTGDLVKPPDLPAVDDLPAFVDLPIPDMAELPDLSVTPDMAVVPDASVIDLAGTADMVVLPDLAMQAPALLVTHVGDGMAALSSAATPVTVRKFQLDGNELKIDSFPLALPVAVNGMQQPITLSGSATSEGHITPSSDGRYAVVVGYAAVPGTMAVAGTMAMNTNRVIGRIDRLGNVDTSTRFNTAFDAANIRSAATDDGTRFWASGSTSGTQFIKFGVQDPGTQIAGTPSNQRVVMVWGGQLYATSGSANYTTVFSVGMGLPTMGGQMAVVGTGLTATGQGPYGFVVLDLDGNVGGVDTMYIADDRTAANGGGIQHWTFDGMKWTLAATLHGGLVNGMRGVAAVVTNNVVTLYATTSESAANSLVSIVDQGMAPMATVLAKAPANTAYRSVCLAPVN